MANYQVNRSISGRPSVNLQSTSLVGPQGPQGPASGYWNSNISGINTTSNVGIGTDSPVQKLDVLGQSRFYGDVNIDGPSEIYFGQGNLTISSSSTDTIVSSIGNYFSIQGNPIVLDSNLVGIGTTNPRVTLDINGNVNISGILTVSSTVNSNLYNGTTFRVTNGTIYNVLEVDGTLWADGGAEFGTRQFNKGKISISTTGDMLVSGISTFLNDVGIGTDNSAGVILTSPNGTQYRIIVDNSGNLSTILI